MKYFSYRTTNDKRSRKTPWRKTGMQPPWRNRLARSAVNRKVGGSSPPGGGITFFHSFNIFLQKSKNDKLGDRGQ
jgi:hypothetical protein